MLGDAELEQFFEGMKVRVKWPEERHGVMDDVMHAMPLQADPFRQLEEGVERRPHGPAPQPA